MPRISEYNAPSAGRGFAPSPGSSDFGAGTAANTGRQLSGISQQMAQTRARSAANEGRAIGEVGQGVAALGRGVQTYMERRDVMNFHAGEAQLTNEMTHAWNEMRTSADPGDPQVAERFNEDVLKPTLEKFGEQFSTTRGQEMAASFGSRFQEHMFNRQAADASVAAGQAALSNLNTVSNNNASALVADPSSLEFINSNTTAMISNYKTSNPNLTAEQVARIDDMGQKMLRENTIAAFHGMASKNPAAAAAALESGFGNSVLDASDHATLTNYARAQENIQKEEARSAQVEARRQEQDAANKDANKLFTGAINSETGELDVGPAYFQGIKDYVEKHPNEETGQAKSLFQVGQKAVADELARKYQTSDPATRDDLNARIVLPADDPRALTPADVDNMYIAGRLSKNDHAMYRQQTLDFQRDPQKRDAYGQFKNFLVSMKSTITQSSPATGNFPQEDQRYGQFQFDMRQQFDQAYANGTWKDLLNPNHASFLGKQAPPYGFTTKAGLATIQSNVRGGVGVAAPVAPPATVKPEKPLDDFMKGGGL